jgi:hypothetical protein
MFGRVLGLGVATDDGEEVRAFGQEGVDRLPARGPQPVESGVAGAGGTGGFRDQQRGMRADGGRDQHADGDMISGA